MLYWLIVKFIYYNNICKLLYRIDAATNLRKITLILHFACYCFEQILITFHLVNISLVSLFFTVSILRVINMPYEFARNANSTNRRSRVTTKKTGYHQHSVSRITHIILTLLRSSYYRMILPKHTQNHNTGSSTSLLLLHNISQVFGNHSKILPMVSLSRAKSSNRLLSRR